MSRSDLPDKNEIPMLHMRAADLGISLTRLDLKELIKEVKSPHRHDHYTCFYVEEGVFTNSIDFREVDVRPNSFLISYPGQIHLLHSIIKCKGWMLSFDDKIIDDNARTIFEESLSEIALLELDEKDNDIIRKALELMSAISTEKSGTLFYRQQLRSMLDVIVNLSASIYKSAEYLKESNYSSRSIELTKAFKKLLRKHYFTIKQPSVYAEMLNISTVYLNDSVKSLTGFPLTHHINHQIIKEAQRLLFYSEYSIKEIAIQLGYEDIKYFHRFFRKNTGFTPTEFRKKCTLVD